MRVVPSNGCPSSIARDEKSPSDGEEFLVSPKVFFCRFGTRVSLFPERLFSLDFEGLARCGVTEAMIGDVSRRLASAGGYGF